MHVPQHLHELLAPSAAVGVAQDIFNVKDVEGPQGSMAEGRSRTAGAAAPPIRRSKRTTVGRDLVAEHKVA